MATGAYYGYDAAKKLNRNPWTGSLNNDAVIEPLRPIKLQAIDLKNSMNNGKNSVTIKTVNGHIRYDLDGAPHGPIETPHVKVYTRHMGPNEKINYSSPKLPHHMTQQEIRIIKNYLMRTYPQRMPTSGRDLSPFIIR